jgi:hypothetical protein
LKKVTAVNIDFSKEDTKIFIPRSIKILNSSLQIGGVYKIKLDDSITNPLQGSTLASNWNNGKVPEYSVYIAEILDCMANMIKINGVAEDNPVSQFIGWLPTSGFETLSKE